MKNVCVLGLGYVGLPTAVMLATVGNRVTGVDVNPAILDCLNNGRVHIAEPGIDSFVHAALKSGNLVIRPQPCPADVFIIAVPTPLTRERQADLSDMRSAASAIVPHLAKGNLVVLESTVPPETTGNILAPILEGSGLKAGRDFYLAYAPERVLPGNILFELVENDRVIGGITRDSAELARELYQGFVKGDISLTDATTAEMVKASENTFRNVNVALANELALVAEKIGVDVWEVISLANRHPRVDILKPGPGVGGHCIPLDPWFLVQKAPEGTPLIRSALNVNDSMPHRVLAMFRREIDGVQQPRLSVFGVTYKGNVDDVRESPVLPLIREAMKEDFQVRAFDPRVTAIDEFPGLLTDVESAVAGSHGIVLLADHDEFRDLDVRKIGCLMTRRLVIDTRNCLDHEKWLSSGFSVRVLGKAVQWR